MKYAKHRTSLKKKPFSISIYLIIFLALVFCVVFYFLKNEKKEVTELPPEIATETVLEIPIANPQSNQISLRTEDGLYSAQVKREVVENLFTVTVVADLPQLEDRSVYYEAWLVKPGVVEYFSVGELFARADGKWGLLYELREDKTRIVPMEYARIILTKEMRDGNPSPSAEHVLEGQF